MKLTSSNKLINDPKLIRRLTTDARTSHKAADGSVTDGVAGWIASQYATTTHGELAAVEGSQRWHILRAMIRDWAILRRNDQAAVRLQLAREQLELNRSNNQAQKEKEFRQWLERPDIREELFPDKDKGLSPETIEKIERELNLL